MQLGREEMYKQTKEFLSILFSLPEVKEIFLKKVKVPAIWEEARIREGVDQCYHDKYSDIDITACLLIHPKDKPESGLFYQQNFNRLKLDGKLIGIMMGPGKRETEALRMCFQNGIRLDFFYQIEENDQIPVLSSEKELETETKQERNLEDENRFWFLAVRTLGKLMREDHMNAAKMSHQLLEEALEIQTKKQDFSSAYLETIIEKDSYSSLDIQKRPCHIAKMIYQTTKCFDIQSLLRNPDYDSRLSNFYEIWEAYQ